MWGSLLKKLLSQLQVQKKINETRIVTVQTEAQKFLLAIVTKLLDKSLLRYSLVRNASWLDPNKILTADLAPKEKCLSSCLQVLVSAGKIKEGDVDAIIREYRDFVPDASEGTSYTAFQSYETEKQRFDSFYYALLAKRK